jgi:hypothetical protein
MLDGNLPRSRSLSLCSLEAGYAFVLAITVADDQGRLDGDPALLRADLFPRRRDVSDEQIAGWFDELVAEGCLHLYQGGDGYEYLHFPAWEDYQRLRKPGEDRRPDPETLCSQCDSNSTQEQKREARSGKREARGKIGKPPQPAATRRISPQTAAEEKKPRKNKYLVPETLSDEQKITVKKFVEAKYPEMIDHVEMLTDQCLRHHRSNDNKARYVRWVSVVETWIERQATQYGGMNGKAGSGDGRGRGQGTLGRIYDAQVARSRRP